MTDPARIDELAEQLAAIDPSKPTDGTIKQLHRDLETLAGDLKNPPSPDQHEQEQGCRQAIDGIRQIAYQTNNSGDPAASSARLLTPQTEFGQYVIQSMIGAGGMGTVYLARHTRLEKTVAIKILEGTAAPDLLARFEREMKAVGKIEHPQIVRALDAGTWNDKHYLVMEFVDGADWSTLVAQNGPLSVGAACELGRQAAEGLHVAHMSDMVHRDIKPANLMLGKQDFGPPQVKILDLGLARLSQTQDNAAPDLTVAHTVMGTLEFMAPEQASDSHSVTTPADVYGLGATMHMLLTGKPPHDTTGKTIVQKLLTIANEPCESIGTSRPDLPKKLVGAIDQMLALDPADRQQSAAHVAEQLAPFADASALQDLLDEAEFHVSAETRVEDAPTAFQPDRSPQTPGNSRRSTGGGRIVAAVGGLLALAAAVMLVIKMNGATITVQLNDPQGLVSVAVEGAEIVVRLNSDDAKSKQETIRLRPGKHQLAVERGELRFKTKEFQLGRGEKAVLDVRLVEADVQVLKDGREIGRQSLHPGDVKAHAPAVTAEVDGDVDRRLAEFVMNSGGVIWIRGWEKGFFGDQDLPLEKFHVVRFELPQPLANQANSYAAFAGCEHIEEIRLPQSQDADSILAHFENCRNLKKLIAPFANITDKGIEYLRNCKALEELDLTNSKLTEDGFQHLAGCAKLRRLVLSGNRCTAKALAAFKDCKQLEELVLSMSPASDIGVHSFSGCTKLKRLHLMGTRVTDKGLAAFSASDQLTELHVASTGVTAQGLRYLGPQKQLKSAFFVRSRVTTEAAIQWMSQSSELMAIHLGDRLDCTDEMLAAFKNQTHLRVVEIGGKHVTNACLAHFAKSKGMENLNFSGTKVTGAGFAEFKKLTRVDLINALANDKTLEELAGHPTLSELFLNGTDVTDQGLLQLAKSKRLRFLAASAPKVSEQGVIELRKRLPTCRVEWSPLERK